MSSTFDRRSFLTHSAATIGGVAMAGTVVDGLLASVAGATVGVNKGKPRRGGTLTVGTISDVPNYHIFNGSQGKLDASGFCVANALYDPLFVMSLNGKTPLPMLALSASHNANYTVWTIKLRQGVNFTNGDAFNAAICVANYAAAKADPTVGLAIQPLISSVTQVDAYTVNYNMVIPFSSFPVSLSESQISYMAHPSSFVPTYTGKPIGTGPFVLKSWQVGVESQFTKNKNYWRTDAAGRQLPYLSGINFKPIADDAGRNQALQSGSIDMMLQQQGLQISELKKMPGITYRTDEHDPLDPAVNCLIMNTTATMNQYFAWAGEFAPAVPGALSYILKGQAPPAAVQFADFEGTLGAVNPSTLKWDTSLKPVINDVSIRKACAMAINRNTYFKLVDGSIGAVADGIYRKTSRFYKNPGYPAYNPTAAKALVAAYKSANNVSSVGFVIDSVAGNASAVRAFSFFQSELAKVGITVTNRPLVQSTLINNVIYGEYDCATWNQFGGVDPSENYVWFISLNATASPAVGGLGMGALPAGTYIAGAVNFAHQADPTIEGHMLAALAAKPGSATQTTAWSNVNKAFSKDIPYLFLDTTVTAWAARKNVQNWVSGTAGDGTTRCLSPDAGSARWDQIWKS
ncbi:MAG TPA: ABC transporter substrate-binding protein [Acidimicrobiales bacterium]